MLWPPIIISINKIKWIIISALYGYVIWCCEGSEDWSPASSLANKAATIQPVNAHRAEESLLNCWRDWASWTVDATGRVELDTFGDAVIEISAHRASCCIVIFGPSRYPPFRPWIHIVARVHSRTISMLCCCCWWRRISRAPETAAERFQICLRKHKAVIITLISLLLIESFDTSVSLYTIRKVPKK